MSYILDALRRADAERQQGRVPGLHAVSAAEPPAAPKDGWRRHAWWLALGSLLVALALLAGWRLLVPGAARPGVAPGPAAQPAAVPATAQASAPAPAAALPIVVSAAPVMPAPSAAAEAVAAVVPAAPKPASVPPGRATPLSSLPPDERRQLPALASGGSVWSDSAASRFVILDGQVLREGDAVAPGVVLERIERKAAVLRWKDQRIEVPF